VVVAERQPQGGQPLGGGVGADRLVGAQVIDVADLGVEQAVLPRAGCPPVRFGGELVELGAGQAPALCDEFGADALRDEPIVVAGVDLGTGEVLAGELAADRDAAHRFDAGGDGDLVGAGDDALCGEVQRLLAAAALPVDGDGGDGLGEPGTEQGPAGGVAGLFADLADGAADDVVDDGMVDPGAIDERPQDVCVQVNGVDRGVGAAGLALGERGADGVDDDSSGHEACLSALVVAGRTPVLRAGRAAWMRAVSSSARTWLWPDSRASRMRATMTAGSDFETVRCAVIGVSA
jgi:hypothetical protein